MEVLNKTFFNEFTVKLPKPAAPIVEALAAKGDHGRRAGLAAPSRLAEFDDLLVVAATETVTEADIEAFAHRR